MERRPGIPFGHAIARLEEGSAAWTILIAATLGAMAVNVLLLGLELSTP